MSAGYQNPYAPFSVPDDSARVGQGVAALSGYLKDVGEKDRELSDPLQELVQKHIARWQQGHGTPESEAIRLQLTKSGALHPDSSPHPDDMGAQLAQGLGNIGGDTPPSPPGDSPQVPGASPGATPAGLGAAQFAAPGQSGYLPAAGGSMLQGPQAPGTAGLGAPGGGGSGTYPAPGPSLANPAPAPAQTPTPSTRSITATMVGEPPAAPPAPPAPVAQAAKAAAPTPIAATGHKYTAQDLADLRTMGFNFQNENRDSPEDRMQRLLLAQLGAGQRNENTVKGTKEVAGIRTQSAEDIAGANETGRMQRYADDQKRKGKELLEKWNEALLRAKAAAEAAHSRSANNIDIARLRIAQSDLNNIRNNMARDMSSINELTGDPALKEQTLKLTNESNDVHEHLRMLNDHLEKAPPQRSGRDSAKATGPSAGSPAVQSVLDLLRPNPSAPPWDK